jgi:hypothetical protein
MDQENVDWLKKALDGVQESLTRRIPVVAVRSPEDLAGEVAALNALLELMMKLSLLS